MSRDLINLAMTRSKQGGRLNVRQGEQLRRALAKAGESMGWAATAATSSNPIDEMLEQITGMLEQGSTSLKSELADSLAAKKVEMEELEKVVEQARALADEKDPELPQDISYVHTARDATVGLVSKTEVATINEGQEAEDLANSIEKSMGKWGRLREQMLTELQDKQKLLNTVNRNLEEFVDSLRGLVHEVLATLG